MEFVPGIAPTTQESTPASHYDVIVAGGGLAGLALSIQLNKAGHSVILFEKEEYPFHRVCGEYISMESYDFLRRLGVDLEELGVSMITRLLVSAPRGKQLQQLLPLGGFGISRFKLDQVLAGIARNAGVVLKENCKVNDISFKDDGFVVEAGGVEYRSRIAVAGFGKRSNLDIKWKREFVAASKNKLNNYVGVKYHVKGDFPSDTISLHCFNGGYCGLVKIEEDRYNCCYLTHAGNLQESKGNIAEMEQTILSGNPHLKNIFQNSQRVGETPVTISQISFDRKSQVEGHVLMVGDAAGMITPLCGNGMSMALHGSKIAAECCDRFLQGKINRAELEQAYQSVWRNEFSKRLKMGRAVQRISLNPSMMNILVQTGKIFPFAMRWIIKQTHGTPF